MNTPHPNLPTTTFALGHAGVGRFDAPITLAALRGTLWVTVDGVLEDFILEAGDTRRFDGRARVIAVPLGGDALVAAWPQPGSFTSSVTTSKRTSVFGPKHIVSGTSPASRPRAMTMRPILRWLWRASKVYQRWPRYASNQALKSIG